MLLLITVCCTLPIVGYVTNTIFLLGDFNFPDVDWTTLSGSSSRSNKFCDLLFQYNLTQIVNEPTHNLGNILDLIITNNKDIIDNLKVHPQHYKPIPADNFVISFTILFPMEHINFSNTTQVIFDYSKANYLGLINFLSHIDFSINFVNTCQTLIPYGILLRTVSLEECIYLCRNSN